jgi:phosphate butyryltransferase
LLETPVAKKCTIAVAQAADADMMLVASGASRWADFLFVGDAKSIEASAGEVGLSSVPGEIVHCADEGRMAQKAVALVREGCADMPMKGLLATSTFLKAVLDKEKGLRKSDLLSEISVIDRVPEDEPEAGEPDKNGPEKNGPDSAEISLDSPASGLQFITDCAMSVAPDLPAKVKILKNALSLAGSLGCVRPKVAVVAAVETINPDMPETLDASALTLMSQRGQLGSCIVDGPLALDNALSERSARHKGIESPVAGHADILLMSDIRMGNVLHKSITYIAKKRVAVAVVGASAPILMSSRSDHPEDKILAVALACRALRGQ